MIFRRLWQSSLTQNDLLSENVSSMKRKPGETIPELASRIRQDAATCDFQSIKDPLDEALRTKFICSVDNEAVLKTLFKLKDDELKTALTTSHLNVVVQSPSLHWGGSKWLVNSPRVSSSGDSPLDNSSHFLSQLSNARSHVDSTLKPN